MRVLVVDDNTFSRILLENHLLEYGYQPILAENGMEAWEILQEQNDIPILITDWMMPVMNGLDLCRNVRQSDKISHYIYIIIYTANTEEDAVLLAMKAGADDFLTKPVSPAELRARLHSGQRIVELEQNQQRHINELERAYAHIEYDLQTAAEIQKALLPKQGQLGSTGFAWSFQPSSFVAGDIFNYFRLNDEYLAFYQIDVAGHGVSAALLSFSLYHQLIGGPGTHLLQKGGNGEEFPLSPAQVLSKLNKAFQSPDQSQYFTIIYGYLHEPSGNVCLSQAAHPHPLHLKNDGSVALCGEGGLPVGMFENAEFSETRLRLEAGERLFIYSDGLTECCNQSDGFFSEERLFQLLANRCGKPMGDIVQEIEHNIRTWHDGDNLEDDTTFLVLEHMMQGN